MVPQKNGRGDPNEYSNECEKGIAPPETEVAISSLIHQ